MFKCRLSTTPGTVVVDQLTSRMYPSYLHNMGTSSDYALGKAVKRFTPSWSSDPAGLGKANSCSRHQNQSGEDLHRTLLQP